MRPKCLRIAVLVCAINREQDSEERTPALEGKILNFELELKIMNSILNACFKLLNKPHLSGSVREVAGLSPAPDANGSG